MAVAPKIYYFCLHFQKTFSAAESSFENTTLDIIKVFYCLRKPIKTCFIYIISIINIYNNINVYNLLHNIINSFASQLMYKSITKV